METATARLRTAIAAPDDGRWSLRLPDESICLRIRKEIICLFILLAVAGFAIAAQAGRAQARTAVPEKRNLPYTTIDHPKFVSASRATFLGPEDIVLGVTDGKTAKAYPAAILAQHGVVEDSTADGPIAVTW